MPLMQEYHSYYFKLQREIPESTAFVTIDWVLAKRGSIPVETLGFLIPASL